MEPNKPGQQPKESVARKLGNKVERLGDKISDKGATRVGKFIRDTGDKVEHMSDKNK